MKAWILSDMHLRGDYEPRVPQADICICAGDISNNMRQSFAWLARRVRPHMPVVFVAGNHEFYDSSISTMREAAGHYAGYLGIDFLDNASVVIGGVRFVGGTLWTDYELAAMALEGEAREKEVAWAMINSRQQLNDHHCITLGPVDRLFRPSDAAQLHRETRAFIEAELSRPFDGPTVVVTHHAPHPRSISPEFTGSSINPAFVSDLTGTITGGRPDLWVHGHVHSSHDYVVGSTRILANPRGYVRKEQPENPDFDPYLIIDLEETAS